MIVGALGRAQRLYPLEICAFFFASNHFHLLARAEDSERLAYILSHGCKENLVARPQDWPGVHCVTALVSGQPIEGTWFDRTKEWEARRRGEKFGAC